MIKIGILGCADIAYRRFMPAAKLVDDIEVIAVSEEYDRSKLAPFCEEYGLEAVNNFETLLSREDVDALYIPQPPALHYRWIRRALEIGKPVLAEKPFTISFELTQELVNMAREKKLALHENYMFQYHSQIKEIQNLLTDGVIGETRLYRADFGFPMRAQNDFRYNKELGGGALLDAGGYAIKLATLLLGNTIRLDTAKLNSKQGYEVDMYGNASFSNAQGMVCQIGFGMDCAYRCSLEVWGSKGRLTTNRIFTAPEGYEPIVVIENAEGNRTISLKADSHFKRSIESFVEELNSEQARELMYEQILLQAKLVEELRHKGN